MSRNNNFKHLEELASTIPTLRNQEKDVICRDCGGISATKIQQLLTTIEDTTNFLKKKNKKSARNNNQKKKTKKNSRRQRQNKKKIKPKRITNSIKKRKLNKKKN